MRRLLLVLVAMAVLLVAAAPSAHAQGSRCTGEFLSGAVTAPFGGVNIAGAISGTARTHGGQAVAELLTTLPCP